MSFVVDVDSSMSDHARQFVRDGYLVVPGLVSAEDVERVRADIDGFRDGSYPLTNPPDGSDILAVHFPHWVSPVANDMIGHAGIASVLADICGAHLPYWDGRVKAMQSMLFLKPPGLPGQAWHQDERYIPTRDRSLLGAWIALDDATIENGCLWVLPGSHRMGYLHPTRDHGRPDEFDPSEEAFGFDDRDAVPVEAKPGDVIFFNGYLLHRSLKNRSTGTRRSLVNHYMNAWSLLPWAVKDGLDVGLMDNRAVIPVAGDDPHEWRGYVPASKKAFVRPSAGAWGNPDPLHVDTSVAIAAPIDVVWATLTDTASYADWNPYVLRVDGDLDSARLHVWTMATTGDPADGVTTAIDYDIDVTRLDAPQLMVWEGNAVDPDVFHGVHFFELVDNGALTVLRHHERFSGSKAESILSRRGAAIAHDFDRFNRALRVEAERRAALSSPT
jgi:phytanoyl-CoA hydroxylase